MSASSSTKVSSRRKDYRQLWEVRRKLYVDWTLRDIIYRLLIRARLEGIYDRAKLVIDKVLEDVQHLDEVFDTMYIFQTHGYLCLLLEPAFGIGDFVALKQVRGYLVEVKPHEPPWGGHSWMQRDYYMVSIDDVRNHGLEILYAWRDRRHGTYMCTTLDHIHEHEVNNRVYLYVTKSWNLREYLKTMG